MNPLLMLSFADGFSGALTIAEPILTATGLRGLEYFPAGSAGLACHLTTGQLLALDAAGWDCCAHGTRQGGDYTSMPPDQVLPLLIESHDYLTGLGITRGSRILGPPAQRWDATLNPLALEAGFQVVSVGLATGGIIPDGYDVEFQSCGANVPLGTVASRIAALPAGKIGILSFHNVRPAVFKENDADPTRVQAVVDLAVASGLTICTFSDLLDT